MTDDTLSALIRACVLAPADAAPRLALADYLEEEGRLDAGPAGALRSGLGEWLIGPHRLVSWVFIDWSERVPVGQVPADVAPGCRQCATPTNLRHLGDMWLCAVCRFAVRSSDTIYSVVSDGEIRTGEPVALTDSGGARRATAADTIMGMAVRGAKAGGRVVIRLV